MFPGISCGVPPPAGGRRKGRVEQQHRDASRLPATRVYRAAFGGKHEAQRCPPRRRAQGSIPLGVVEPNLNPTGTLAPALDVGKATDVGRVRDSNEDSLMAVGVEHEGLSVAPGHALLAVADGMGGHQAGEVASALAVEALADALSDKALARERLAPDAWLRSAVQSANRRVWEAAGLDNAREGMGTTLVCALVHRLGNVAIANVGDSRAYLVTPMDARQVTRDHSWVEEQVRQGRMSEEEAQQSPYRHVLSRSLGVEPSVGVDVYVNLRLRPGDALVLCSDGVSMYLDPEDFSRQLSDAVTAREAAELLVRLALSRGGADNATVIVARMRS